MASRTYRQKMIAVQNAQLAAMSTEELEHLCAGGPEIDFTGFSIEEIEQLLSERASPALYARLHKAEAAAQIRENVRIIK